VPLVRTHATYDVPRIVPDRTVVKDIRPGPTDGRHDGLQIVLLPQFPRGLAWLIAALIASLIASLREFRHGGTGRRSQHDVLGGGPVPADSSPMRSRIRSSGRANAVAARRRINGSRLRRSPVHRRPTTVARASCTSGGRWQGEVSRSAERNGSRGTREGMRYRRRVPPVIGRACRVSLAPGGSGARRAMEGNVPFPERSGDPRSSRSIRRKVTPVRIPSGPTVGSDGGACRRMNVSRGHIATQVPGTCAVPSAP